MTTLIDPVRRANLLGSLWMVAAMAVFAVEDAFIKASSRTIPIGEILMIFGLGGALVFACLALANRQRLFRPEVYSRSMRLRALFEIGGRLFYVLAIALTPLSAATAILQATPIVVVAGAAIIFRERVGPGRWIAILVGLLGVMVIIRPGSDSFSVLSLLAVLGMLGFAGRDLASRAAPAALSTSLLGLYGFLAVFVSGLIYALWEAVPLVVPGSEASLFLTGAVLAGATAYACLMKAMRTGEVSAVTPFRYTRLLFGIGLGVMLFGEQLSLPMIVGSGLIVASGLFILGRGRRLPRR